MPTITGQLDSRGRAIVPIEVAVPAARARAFRHAGQPPPQPLRLDALIDTGASRTCIDPQVSRALHLTAFSAARLSTPSFGGPAVAGFPLYKVNLTVLHPSGNTQLHLARSAFPVAGIHLAHVGTEVVIGRDLLARCRFVYDGLARTFELEY